MTLESPVLQREPRGVADDASTTSELMYERLHAEYASDLMGYVLGLTRRNRQLAEDIVQETMLRAWLNLSKLDMEPGLVRGWLWKVASRISIDDYRRRSARPTEVDGEVLTYQPVSDGIDQLLASVVVSDAFESLSTQHREIVALIHLRGYSVTEAAKVLGVPAGTVKSRTHYAMRALRLALEERGLVGLHGE